MKHYDIAIIGGGLVGASLAHALANTDLDVILVDNQPVSNMYAPALDNRGLALSYVSMQILTALDIWSRMQTQAWPITTVHVSQQGKFGFTKLHAKKLDVPALGYVISASALGTALLSNIPENVVSLRPTKVKTFCYDDMHSNWTVVTDTEKFTTNLLVGADGTNSMVRSCLGINTTTTDFSQTAIVTNIRSEHNNSIAYERFTESGVLALLPFGDYIYKCVLTVANEKLSRLMELNDDAYTAEIQNLFGYRLGKLSACAKRKTFPIRDVEAENLTAPGVVLLGNAANTLHPVAAQGFNLGLRDVMALADLLQVYDCYRAVELYAHHRTSDQSSTRKFTHQIINLPDNIKKTSILAAQIIPAVNNMLTRRGIGTWI